ncbi:MAG TPA: phosphoribosyltransferase [Bryobacteraceae bacterium]|jgi:putative phosphoribosyl transferase|nr:phosphoribosyltransferase [Bryobacteraceae bacterium]
MPDRIFQNRSHAGQLLAEELKRRKLPAETVVLALPRGGVPIGFAVAHALHAALDVMVVRKLGVPWQPELAIGAIAGGHLALNQDLIQELGISQPQIQSIVEKETAELHRRETLYRSGRPALRLSGRTVVLVDDGLATGSTMMVAARFARSLGPARLIVCAPIGSQQACHRMKSQCDECICLARPDPFIAVGEWYEDFQQISDAEVSHLLAESQLAPVEKRTL